MEMTEIPVLANTEECTGCMACLNACPKEALSFIQDEEGFLMPCVNKEKCIGCHLCERSCPEVQGKFHQNAEAESAYVYAGWNKTYRSVSSSGGAFSSVAQYILNKGGVVFGVALGKDLQCYHIEVDNMEGLERLRGSKYIQSNIGETFRKAKEQLIVNREILFTGTPCQISGLKSYLGKEYPNLITIDLICHGVPSNALFRSYIEKLRDRIDIAENEKIEDFEFRDREKWTYASSVLTNKKRSLSLYNIDDLYMSSFHKCAIFRRSCYHCHYATTKRVGDFSIGDFWGLGHHGKKFNYSKTKGVSLLMVNSEKGRAIVEQLGDEDFYIRRSLQEATPDNHNLAKPSPRPENREKVIRAFLDPNISLEDIEREYRILDKSIKKRIAQLSLKLGLYDFLKSIYYRIV